MDIPDHEIQRTIITKLMHAPIMGFNELWAKEFESNSFAYHLSRLEDQGLVEKKDSKYMLTQKGKTLSASIEGTSGKRSIAPTMSVLLIVKKNGKYVCCERRKEPFYGYWSHPAGKIQLGENLAECASRELLEETGLVAKEWTFKGIQMIKTYEGDEDNKLLFHHYLFFMQTSDPQGDLKKENDEGTNEWLTNDEFHKKTVFPGQWYSTIMEPAKHPMIVEGIRRMKDGKFIGAELASSYEIGSDDVMKEK